MSKVHLGRSFFDIRGEPSYSSLKIGSGILDGRPYIRLWDDLCTIYVLDDPIHRWFEDHGIFYKIFFPMDCGNIYVDIPNRYDAILFKLTWHGIDYCE